MNTQYRALTPSEIAILKANNSRADQWTDVLVGAGFDANFVVGCTFSGEVTIGATGAEMSLADGITVRSGLYNTHIIDTNICDNCYINGVSQYIAHQDIADGVIISGVGVIEASGDCCFGNGTRISTINEGGGREVAIFDRLSSQIAYIVAMYRHRPQMVEAYERMVEEYTNSVRHDKGIIEAGARITGTKIIKNSRIGSFATIESAALLKNCSVNSSEDNPSYVGVDVKIENSIIDAGARIDSSAMLSHCYVNDAVKISKGFFAEHSLFFSGSDMALGEACSIFAGPFTVSHHRSSLLIAGMFSFFNAGSGANQSNHLYRTGPVHQGIHRRGCKFGSNAYVLSPALTGAFTLVSGSHKSNHDTEAFPFSYLIEEESKSYLMPGSNLRSYGTARDCKKWQNRDRRHKDNRDLITFDKFSPYIIQHIVEAIAISKKLLDKPNTSGVYTHNRVKIKGTMLSHGIKLYEKAVNIFLSQALELDAKATRYDGLWVDLAGMVAPKTLVNQLIDQMENSQITTLQQLQSRINEIDAQRLSYTKGWAENMALRILEQQGLASTLDNLTELVSQGQTDQEYLDGVIAEDAKKDSSKVMSTGYGADDPASDCWDEFLNIRASQAK